MSPHNLILPVFVHDGEQNLPIASMPGVDRLGWRHGLLDSVAEARSVGVNSVVLFPKVRLSRRCTVLSLVQLSEEPGVGFQNTASSFTPCNPAAVNEECPCGPRWQTSYVAVVVSRMIKVGS